MAQGPGEVQPYIGSQPQVRRHSRNANIVFTDFRKSVKVGAAVLRQPPGAENRDPYLPVHTKLAHGGK